MSHRVVSGGEELNEELAMRLREFEDAKEEMGRLVAGVSDEIVNRQPVQGGWSMAACTDHLVVVGDAMVPSLRRAIDRGRARGRDGPLQVRRLWQMVRSYIR